MYTDSKFVFYEKQYYHEIETKQKIDLRLQTIIIFTFAWVNFASYTLQVVDYDNNKFIAIIFYNLIAAYGVFIFTSLRYSIFSFYGNVYHYLKPPSVFENYYNEVNDYYTKYENDKTYADKEIKDFIKENLINCTDHNSKLNDIRSQNAFESTKWLVIAFVPFFIAFMIFIVFKLDLKHPTKPILIEEKNLSGAYINVSETITTEASEASKGGQAITTITTKGYASSP